jgi:hypothetical protein
MDLDWIWYFTKQFVDKSVSLASVQFLKNLSVLAFPDRSGRPQDAEAESAAQEMFWSVDVLVIEETKESSG